MNSKLQRYLGITRVDCRHAIWMFLIKIYLFSKKQVFNLLKNTTIVHVYKERKEINNTLIFQKICSPEI